MDKALLIQLIGSVVAIAMLVGIAAWAGIGRPTPPLDAEGLRQLLAVEFPDHHPTAAWFSEDGTGALAREGDTVLVFWRRGDGYVARDVPWSVVTDAKPHNGHVTLKLPDAKPVFGVSGDIWPPKDLAA